MTDILKLAVELYQAVVVSLGQTFEGLDARHFIDTHGAFSELCSLNYTHVKLGNVTDFGVKFFVRGVNQ